MSAGSTGKRHAFFRRGEQLGNLEAGCKDPTQETEDSSIRTVRALGAQVESTAETLFANRQTTSGYHPPRLPADCPSLHTELIQSEWNPY